MYEDNFFSYWLREAKEGKAKEEEEMRKKTNQRKKDNEREKSGGGRHGKGRCGL